MVDKSKGDAKAGTAKKGAGKDSTAKKGATPKKGATKKTPPKVVKPIQVVRVRCACDSHDPPAKPSVVEAPPPKGHEKRRGKAAPRRKPAADPWVRGLYVVWAPKPPDGTNTEFSVAQTDDFGHLTMPGEGNDSFKIATHEGQEFMFWFVRHPDAAVAKQVRDAVSAGDRKTYGPGFVVKLEKDAKPDPEKLVLSVASTGKGASGKNVVEPVLSIPPKASFFVPKGSKLYDEWLLFHLPVYHAKTKKMRDVQPFEACPDLMKQVRRLQYHLGSLRYLVGDHGHPYRPTQPKRGSFPNEGVFDLVTWNSVLRFQADARAGSAVAVPSHPHKKLLTPIPLKAPDALDPSWGEPAGVSDDDEDKLCHEYGKITSAGAVPSHASPIKGAVEAITAGAIAEWIAKGWRRPGAIMVTVPGNPAMQRLHWLREDARERMIALSERIKQLGFTKGMGINHTYRDARVDALGAGFGRAKRSIHKTGYAVDLWMSGFQPTAAWPIKFTMEHEALAAQQAIQAAANSEDGENTIAGKRVKAAWRLYAPVDGQKSENPDDASYYAEGIMPWAYDSTSPMGGMALPPEPGTWIDLTRVAAEYGFVRIHSFGDDNLSKQDWRGGPRLMPCEKVTDLPGVIEELTQVRGNSKLADAVVWVCPEPLSEGFIGKSNAMREAELEEMGATKVEVSEFDTAELAAISAWIGNYGAKNLPADLSVEMKYQIKAAKEPEKLKALLEEQLKTRFSPLITAKDPSKTMPLDGWKFECVSIEAEGEGEDAVPAGSVLSTVTLTKDCFVVGEEEGQFPNKSFRFRPTQPTLGENLPMPPAVYFPTTVGESIGMEWWHIQFSKGLAMNDKQLAEARADARKREKALEETIEGYKKTVTSCDAIINDKKAKLKDKTIAKKAKRDAGIAQKKAEAEKKKASRIAVATALGATWWSMIEAIGWTEEAMRHMGYVNDDFTATAH